MYETRARTLEHEQIIYRYYYIAFPLVLITSSLDWTPSSLFLFTTTIRRKKHFIKVVISLIIIQSLRKVEAHKISTDLTKIVTIANLENVGVDLVVGVVEDVITG